MATYSLIHLPKTFPVTAHTDFVGPDSTFVAIKGNQYDGVHFISQALERGATTIVVADTVSLSSCITQKIAASGARIMRVADTRYALATLSAQAAGYPAKQLTIIGITGTKGKTTTSFLLAHMFESAGVSTALLSTVGNRIGQHQFSTHLTTQQPDYLHQFFALCVQTNVSVVIMEVAAQALSLHRTAGIEFDGALFTNFSQEHGEFYATQQDYFNAKCLLFDQVKYAAPCIVNADDLVCNSLLEKKQHLGFSMHSASMPFYGEIQETTDYHARLLFKYQSKEQLLVCPALVGTFNCYNILAAASMASMFIDDSSVIQKALTTFKPVPGRMEHYQLDNGARCIIDYAHTPSSYQELFSLLATWTDNLIVVFGAGGARDKEKRPVMGAIAALFAHTILLTSDNPRNEDPHAIVDDILTGIPLEKRESVFVELDREQAIKKAYALSKSTSIIVLLGKGPDEYQLIGSEKIYFSEKQIVALLQ